jgi:hypothetical protein
MNAHVVMLGKNLPFGDTDELICPEDNVLVSRWTMLTKPLEVVVLHPSHKFQILDHKWKDPFP